jgi:hypothetical protein
MMLDLLISLGLKRRGVGQNGKTKTGRRTGVSLQYCSHSSRRLDRTCWRCRFALLPLQHHINTCTGKQHRIGYDTTPTRQLTRQELGGLWRQECAALRGCQRT